MELRDLVYFQTIAEAGHLGRAAERLGRTQPALTKSIRRLEDDIGAELFDRSGRGLRLTSVGEVLLARARQLRQSVETTRRELQDVMQGAVGHVRIGSAATTAEYLLPTLFGHLLRDTPGVTIELLIGMNDVLRGSLRSGKLDLVISPLTDRDGEFSTVPVMEDEVVVVARKGHPLSDNARLEDLCGQRWILPGPSVAMRQWLENVFASRGLSLPEVQIETSSMVLLPKIIAQTDLLSFISRRTLNRVQNDNLTEIPLAETTMFRRLGVIYPRDHYLSPAARRLIDLVRELTTDPSALA
jgi:DNA-binding transcriptional LysR family regulator